MEVAEALRRLGGVADTADLVGLTSRARLRVAVARGEVIRTARSRYALPGVPRQRVTAHRLAGTLSHLSAAQHHGWALAHPPERAWVTVPRNRKVAREVRVRVHVVHADLRESDHRDGVTTALRTVLDCARRLPFAEALAVADSALRAGAVAPDELVVAAAATRGRGTRECRRVAAAARGRAANPFESVLRALVLDVGGLDVVPQATVRARGWSYEPDLVDTGRRVVIEAESWGFHADGQTFARDCVRYNALTVAGWRVLRFTWEQVMTSPAYVRSVLADL